jgi:hypothetical protein
MRQVIAFVALSLLAMIGTVSVKPFSEIYVPSGAVLSEPTQVEKFMEKIAVIETPGGGYQTVNRFGMMGRYQFSHETVKAVGINTSRQEFLSNKELQDTAMVRLMILNEKQLSDVINRYEGRMVKGVRITRASILAGAHFAGAGGVKAFLTNTNPVGTVDGFGMSLAQYMKHFNNFHLPPLRG